MGFSKIFRLNFKPDDVSWQVSGSVDQLQEKSLEMNGFKSSRDSKSLSLTIRPDFDAHEIVYKFGDKYSAKTGFNSLSTLLRVGVGDVNGDGANDIVLSIGDNYYACFGYSEKEVVHHQDMLRKSLDGAEAFNHPQRGFAKLLEDIHAAKKSITINMFLWRNDTTGRALAKALVDAANRGVKVTINKDSLGLIPEYASGDDVAASFFHKDIGFTNSVGAIALAFVYGDKTLYDIKNGFSEYFGAEDQLSFALWGNPNITVNIEKFRDHSKFVMIDPETSDARLHVLDFNMGDEYLARWNGYSMVFRDPETVDYYSERLKGRHPMPSNNEKRNPLEFYFNQVDQGRAEILTEVLSAIRDAKKDITIQMAYMGHPEVSKALIDASNRGVRVTVICGKRADILDDSNKRTLKELHRDSNGEIKIGFQDIDNIHSKLMVVDSGKIIVFGSYNYMDSSDSLGDTIVVMSFPNPNSSSIAQSFNTRLRVDMRRVSFIGDPSSVDHSDVIASGEDLYALIHN